MEKLEIKIIVKTDSKADYDLGEMIRKFIDLLPHAEWIRTETKVIG